MAKGEQKFYVVRKGKKTGIFDSRDECKIYVNGFSGAKYKSFTNIDEAENAIKLGREPFYANVSNKKPGISDINLVYDNIPFFKESIAVDAACSGNPGILEYRGIDLQNGDEIFYEKFELGTNNIGEFLAIIHGLQYLEGSDKKIYSDSRNAISRVENKKCKTQFDFSQFKELKLAVEDAENWIKGHGINNKILKWNTEERGEIPADFGRK